jgi:brefeldin A-resistance guanine nucleotide exchange factor 1
MHTNLRAGGSSLQPHHNLPHHQPHSAAGGSGGQLLSWALRAVQLGGDAKAQLALRTLAALVHAHAHTTQDGWKNILDCLLTLFHARLLPVQFVHCEDFVASRQYVDITPDHGGGLRAAKSAESGAGLLSSLVLYFGGSSQADARAPRQPNDQELTLMRAARECVQDADLWCVVSDSKYMPLLGLQHLIHAIIHQSNTVHTNRHQHNVRTRA